MKQWSEKVSQGFFPCLTCKAWKASLWFFGVDEKASCWFNSNTSNFSNYIASEKINTQHAPFAFLFRCGAKSTGNILAFIFGLVNLEYKSGNPSQTMLRRRDAYRSVSQAFHVYQKNSTLHILHDDGDAEKRRTKNTFLGRLSFFSSVCHILVSFQRPSSISTRLPATDLYPMTTSLFSSTFFFVCALSQYSAFVWSAQAHLGTLWVDRS